MIPEAEDTVQAHEDLWTKAVNQVSNIAQERLSKQRHGHLQRATALVLNGKTWMEEDGVTCHVRSSKKEEETWYTPNGICQCRDWQEHPKDQCKHQYARIIYYKASELLVHGLAPTTTLEDAVEPQTHGIPAQYVVYLHGKPFVTYQGLLALAHERGLVSLTAEFISVTADLALAKATAVFQDGRTFTEAADATPGNVGAQIKPSFARMALTRAKGRCLRDALNIGICTVEELGGE